MKFWLKRLDIGDVEYKKHLADIDLRLYIIAKKVKAITPRLALKGLHK